jgi:hypothetical protein
MKKTVQEASKYLSMICSTCILQIPCILKFHISTTVILNFLDLLSSDSRFAFAYLIRIGKVSQRDRIRNNSVGK